MQSKARQSKAKQRVGVGVGIGADGQLRRPAVLGSWVEREAGVKGRGRNLGEEPASACTIYLQYSAASGYRYGGKPRSLWAVLFVGRRL